jgi:hypothetical protein
VRRSSSHIAATLQKGYRPPGVCAASALMTGAAPLREPNEFVREVHTRMPVIRKSITMHGYLVKPEKKSWSLSRRTE